MSANVTVGVTDVHPLTQSPLLGSYSVCGQHQPAGSEVAGPTVSVQCSSPILSQYVIVQLETTDHMGLCKVEAYATQGVQLVLVNRRNLQGACACPPLESETRKPSCR